MGEENSVDVALHWGIVTKDVRIGDSAILGGRSRRAGRAAWPLCVPRLCQPCFGIEHGRHGRGTQGNGGLPEGSPSHRTVQFIAPFLMNGAINCTPSGNYER